MKGRDYREISVRKYNCSRKSYKSRSTATRRGLDCLKRTMRIRWECRSDFSRRDLRTKREKLRFGMNQKWKTWRNDIKPRLRSLRIDLQACLTEVSYRMQNGSRNSGKKKRSINFLYSRPIGSTSRS
jgi:hypothetical protein